MPSFEKEPLGYARGDGGYISRECADAHHVDNKVAVLILQHPQEQDRVLGTAKLICSTLAHAKLTIGLSWRNLGHALGETGRGEGLGRALSRLGACGEGEGRAGRARPHGRAFGRPGPARAGLKGIVALDGNWAQAKALWWRNAWLTRLRRFVVVPDGPSLYGDLRREARPDAVSTLEAVGLALAALEGNGAGAGGAAGAVPRAVGQSPHRRHSGQQTGSKGEAPLARSVANYIKSNSGGLEALIVSLVPAFCASRASGPTRHSCRF